MDNQGMKIQLALLLLGSLISPAVAQPYPIRIHRPIAVGQQFHLTSQGRETHKGSFSAGGKTVQDTKLDLTVDFAALVTVLEASEKGELVKASYAITNCLRALGKEKKQLFPSGTVVIGWLEGREEKFTVSDKPVEKDVQRALALATGLGKEQLLSDEMLGTDTSKNIGDSWDIKIEPALELLQKMEMGASKQDIQGRTTLEQVAKTDDIECLELAAKIYIKKVSPALPPALEMKSSFGTIRLTGKFPTDPKMRALEDSIEITADFTAQGKSPPNVAPPTFKGGATIRMVSKMVYLKKP
jgi:hypothetical protein